MHIPKANTFSSNRTRWNRRGTIVVDGLGEQREKILDSWIGSMKSNGVVINEGESCKSVKKAEDGDYFAIQTQRPARP